MLKPTVTASTRVHRGRVVDVFTETLRFANGREYEIDMIKHPGAAAVVAVDGAAALAKRAEQRGIEELRDRTLRAVGRERDVCKTRRAKRFGDFRERVEIASRE